MTAKEALELLETIYDIGGGKPHRIFNGALDFEEQEQVIKTINQALEELEAIKSADGGEALEAIDNLISITLSGNRLISNVRNYILKAQAKEKELTELKKSDESKEQYSEEDDSINEDLWAISNGYL